MRGMKCKEQSLGPQPMGPLTVAAWTYYLLPNELTQERITAGPY